MKNENTKNAIVACRVSDSKQLAGNGLEDQERIGLFTANRIGAHVVKVFKHAHSGRKTERGDLDEIIAYIKKSKIKIHYLIIKGIDRLTRNGYPVFAVLKKELETLGVQLIDSSGIIQPQRNTLEHLGDFDYDWAKDISGEVFEMIEAHKGKNEVHISLSRMIGAEIFLVQDGFRVRRAPDGYKNERVYSGNKKRVILAPDPERAHFFETMFELRIRGLSDKEAVEQLNAMGYRTKEQNKWDKKKENIIGKIGKNKLNVKQFQRFICNPIYAGINIEKWTKGQPAPRRYKGLISVEKFNQANRGKIHIKENENGDIEIIDNKKIKEVRLKNNPYYPFKFFLCHICDKKMMGSAPKNKMNNPSPRYHCGGTPSRKHKYYSISKDEFENNILKYIQSLNFNPEYLEPIKITLLNKYREREQEVVEASSKISRNVSDLKAEQSQKLRDFSNSKSPVLRELIEKEVEQLDIEIKKAEEKRDYIEINERDIKAFIRHAKEIMEHPSKMLINIDDMRTQEALFGLVFKEIPSYQKIINGTPELTWIFKASREYEGNKTRMVTPRGVEPLLPG